MTKAHWDYVPRKDSELVPWSINFAAQVADNAVMWGIPPEEVSDLQSATNTFAKLHSIVDTPARTSISVMEKNGARDRLTEAIRDMAGSRLQNPIITDAQRIALGIHVHDENADNQSNVR